MKVALIITAEFEFTQMMRPAMQSGRYRVIQRTSVDDAELPISHGLADVCLLDLGRGGAHQLAAIERSRRLNPRLPILGFMDPPPAPELEVAAYRAGAQHVFTKPVNAGSLAAVLDHLFEFRPQASPPVGPAFSPQEELPEAPKAKSPPAITPEPLAVLEFFSRFSGVMNHSLNAEAMLKEVLLLIREVIGVNRAAIFMRPHMLAPAESATHPERHVLSPACGLGLPWELLRDVELSLDTGIGGKLKELGRIVRREAPEAGDPETQKEFHLLKAQVAVPILDREHLLGVAVFDSHLTGESLTRTELKLIFHVLEQVGVAMMNVQRELASSRRTAELAFEADKLKQSQAIFANLVARINNDMVPIKLLLDLLPRTDLDAGPKKMVASADTSAQRIMRRMQQLTYVAVAATETTGKKVPLASLLQQATKEAVVQVLVGEPTANQVKIGPIESSLMIIGNTDALRWAVDEILRNGLETTNSEPMVSVAVEREARGGLTLAFSDNGPGFSAEEIRHAGTPFYTTKPSVVGLGLYVARHIIEAHGGQLILPPEPAAGGRAAGIVKVRLPASAISSK